MPSMQVLLYSPGAEPKAIKPEGFVVPKSDKDFAAVPDQVRALLNCHPDLVDILACGAGYVVYSVFDSEGEENLAAMVALSRLTGIDLNADDEDEQLRGNILFVDNR